MSPEIQSIILNILNQAYPELSNTQVLQLIIDAYTQYQELKRKEREEWLLNACDNYDANYENPWEETEN